MASYSESLEQLQGHLHTGEAVEAGVSGVFEMEFIGTNVVRHGIHAATDRRLIFFSKKLKGDTIETFSYENISSIEARDGTFGDKIAFDAAGKTGQMSMISEGAVARLVESVRSRMGTGARRGSGCCVPALEPTDSVAADADDPYERIRKLSRLRDQGIITAEEFEARKAAMFEEL